MTCVMMSENDAMLWYLEISLNYFTVYLLLYLDERIIRGMNPKRGGWRGVKYPKDISKLQNDKDLHHRSYL